ncbi:MAG: hypothetical protein P0S96_04470 [Simkaniaceae bacterium]|nr:hypothetical protein [Candidatus Sacchlamyda saccharinae]
MGDFGYDLAAESVGLFAAHEARVYEVIEGKNNEIDALVTEMEDLEHVLSLLAKASDSFKTDDQHVVEIENEDVERIQRLSQNPELRHIFPSTKFSWMDGEITQVAKDLNEKLKELSSDDNLQRMITQRVEGPLQRNIGMKTEEVMHEQLELGKAVELFNKGLQRMISLTERILSNMARH